LRLRLGLPKPKLVGARSNNHNKQWVWLKIWRCICSWQFLHNYVYCTHNNLVDSNYSMLLGRPWLRDVKMAHDWGNNIVTYKGMKQLEQLLSLNIWEVK
jgi:hypothetical protein